MLTIGETVRRQAQGETYGRKVALVPGAARVTCGELNVRVNRPAHALLGVGRGVRVALLGRSSMGCAGPYFALAKIGAILVPLNVRYRSAEPGHALTRSGSTSCVYEREFGEVVQGLRAELPAVKEWLAFGGQARPGAAGDLEALVEGASAEEPAVEVGEKDPRVIVHTTGTTGCRTRKGDGA